MNDQANKLRQMALKTPEQKPIEKVSLSTKIYSIVSGKGGVGKTNFSINLAIKLQQSGMKTLIVDADIGMNNANILLGILAPLNLADVINGDKGFKDIIIKGPGDIDLICGGTDLFLIENLHRTEQEEIIRTLEEFGNYDIIIIDNGAGINKHSLTFSSFADEIILVTTPEPTALTDAYRILKANYLYNVRSKVNVVINQVVDINQGELSYNKLKNTCDKFLNIELESMGYIFSDTRVSKAIMDQSPLVIKYPKALSSQNIDDIAKKILGLEFQDHEANNLKRLGNRLLKFFG